MDVMLRLQVMYAAAVIGAGMVGALTLFAPVLASRYVFFGATAVDPYHRILGSLWLSLGLVAGLGLLQPMDFIAVLLIQLFYKFAWLIAVAYPAIFRGNQDTGLLFLTGLFTVWVAALSVVVPSALRIGAF